MCLLVYCLCDLSSSQSGPVCKVMFSLSWKYLFFFFFFSHNQSVNSNIIKLMCSSGNIHELLQMSFVLNYLTELLYLPSTDYIIYIFVLYLIIYISVLSVAFNVFYFTLYLYTLQIQLKSKVYITL